MKIKILISLLLIVFISSCNLKSEEHKQFKFKEVYPSASFKDIGHFITENDEYFRYVKFNSTTYCITTNNKSKVIKPVFYIQFFGACEMLYDGKIS